MTRLWGLGALLAAVLLVLLGRVLPLPPLVTGEEGVRLELVKTRLDAVTARYEFQTAALAYERFLGTHDVPNVPNELREKAADLDAGGDRTTLNGEVRTRVQLILDLGHSLLARSIAGDKFFAELRTYDDQLMGWSRTLGPRSEQLRRDTWPILEGLKRYPAPVGTTDEVRWVPSSSDSPLLPLITGATPAAPPLSTTMALLDQMAPAMEAPDVSSDTIRKFAQIADDVWVAGAYIPTVDQFHDGYFSALRRYDAQALEVAATPDDPLPAGQRVPAWLGAGAVAALLLAALLLMFLPPTFWSRVPWFRPRRAALESHSPAGGAAR
jgi:hypothetical protein